MPDKPISKLKIGNTGIAISWVISRTFVMACLMAVARILGKEGMNFYNVIFWQNAFGLIIMLGYCSYKRSFPKTKQPKLHLLRCILGMCSGSLLYYCLPLMTLNKATAITFTGPMFSTIAAMIFLKEKTSWHRTIGLLVGFVGVLIVLRPGTSAYNPISGLLLLVPMIWGVTDVTIKKLIGAESVKTLLFYMSVIMFMLSLPFGIYHWQPLTIREAILCLALTLFNLGNFLTISNAFKRADISVLMPFEFFRLVFSSILAYLIFSEIISWPTIAGSLVILGSSIYVVHREKQRRQHIENLYHGAGI